MCFAPWLSYRRLRTYPPSLRCYAQCSTVLFFDAIDDLLRIPADFLVLAGQLMQRVLAVHHDPATTSHLKSRPALKLHTLALLIFPAHQQGLGKPEIELFLQYSMTAFRKRRYVRPMRSLSITSCATVSDERVEVFVHGSDMQSGMNTSKLPSARHLS